MSPNTKKHVDELYTTGKTTFRDIDGAYPDYVVELYEMVDKWSVSGVRLIGDLLMLGEFLNARNSFDIYVESEIKQLCIDYYGEE